MMYCKQLHKNFKPHKLPNMPPYNHKAETCLHKLSQKINICDYTFTILSLVIENFEHWMEVSQENIIKIFHS